MTGNMAPVVEYLPSKCEVLSSNSSTAEKKIISHYVLLKRLFKNMLFNFQMFEDFNYLSLISSFIPLWLENIL
jgi:hypothetical protein